MNGPVTTNTPRIIQTWLTPERIYISSVVTAVIESGVKGNKEIVKAVVKIIPNWRSAFDKPVTDNALVMRGKISQYNRGEHPEVHALKKKIWPQAKQDVANGECTFEFFKDGPALPPLEPEPVSTEPAKELSVEQGYVYILTLKGSYTRSTIGITTDFKRRIKDHEKGGNGRLEIYRIFSVASFDEAKLLESTFKSRHQPYQIGGKETYNISPPFSHELFMTISHQLKIRIRELHEEELT